MAMTSTRALAVAAATCATVVLSPLVAGRADDEASAVFDVKIPAGYRDWQLISVAHEAGSLNDLRAILGNDIAARAFRERTTPFPDGAIIARLAWRHEPSAENNAVFGQVQFSVKDTRRYADTGGWGFGQFEGGRPNRNEALLNTCFPCHNRAPGTSDFVFTRYAP
jgi:Cytochrome P460